jgi:site-specific DNA recombinase
MTRLALYARVSSDRQEREETIDSQLAQLRELAVDKKLSVLDRHVYLDDGYSGDLMARPGLDRLRDDVRDGLLDLVLVHCPDRLARRYPYQVVVIEELQKHGCEIDFVNREIAHTPEDQMLLAMQGVIAEYERAKIMERSRRGRLHKLHAGCLVITNAPFGYRWLPKQGSERGRVEIVPEEAELVRRIYRWIAEEGLTILGVSRRLMDLHIPAPQGGLRWGASTIQNLVRNRAYIGEWCLNRVIAVEPRQPPKPGVYRRTRKTSAARRPAGEWIIVPGPAILEKGLFDAVQKRLDENRRFALRRNVYDNRCLLRCLLSCGCCGYSIIATYSQRTENRVFCYYACIKRTQRTRYGDPSTRCALEPMKADVLDDIVWNDLRELMSDPARIASHAGLDNEAEQQPLKSELDNLEHEIRGCERQLQRLLDAYQRDAMDLDDLIQRRKQIEERKEALVEAKNHAAGTLNDERIRSTIRQQLPQLVEQIRAGLQSADFATRQRLVRLLIDRIVVQPNYDLEIHYLLPGVGHVVAVTGGPGTAGKPTQQARRRATREKTGPGAREHTPEKPLRTLSLGKTPTVSGDLGLNPQPPRAVAL